MQINGERKINAKRTTVFAALNDVSILKKAVPGCEDITQESYNEFIGSVVAKVGPIKSKFVGKAHLENVLPPESYTIIGEGKGGPAGNVKVSAEVVLSEENSTTKISYSINAKISGKLAQLGGPIIKKTTEKLSENFFENLQKILDGTLQEDNTKERDVFDTLSTMRITVLTIAICAIGYAVYLGFLR